MTSIDAIGWASSAILVATISKQVYRQWEAGSSKGVSKYLFLGQIAASVGFTVYSVLVKNTVFIVTNAMMLVAAFVGLALLFHHRRRERRAPKTEEQPPATVRVPPSARRRRGLTHPLWRAKPAARTLPRDLHV